MGEAYERAGENGDLHQGDCHVIKIQDGAHIRGRAKGNVIMWDIWV